MSEATVTDSQDSERISDCWKDPRHGVAKLLAEEIVVIPCFTEIVAAVWEKADLVDGFDRVRQEIREIIFPNEEECETQNSREIWQKWCTLRQDMLFKKGSIADWRVGLLEVLFFDILRDYLSVRYGDNREKQRG